MVGEGEEIEGRREVASKCCDHVAYKVDFTGSALCASPRQQPKPLPIAGP